MYDIGENTAALEEAESKRKARKQMRQQKRTDLVRKISEIVRLVRTIKEKKAKLEEQGKLSPQEMKFTGNMTDIAGVDGMKCTDVKNHMPNNEIYEATKKNIMSAQKGGYIEIDNDKVIHLTDKGREFTQSESFIKQFENDQMRSAMEQLQQQMPEQNLGYVELSGTPQDMGVFQYTDHIDMRAIEDSPNKQAVINNFKELEKKGLVKVEDGIVSPTEQGLDFSSTQSFKLKPASNDEIKTVFGGDIDADGIPNRIDSDYSYIEPAQKASTAQGTVKTANEVGQAAQSAKGAAEGAKAAATAGKAAASTASTAGKTAASVGGTAATAGTAAATGAATAGVGAVVVVAADVMKKAVEQVNNTIKQTMQSVKDSLSK